MLGSTVRIAWRNLGRNRKRTALALTAISIAQLTLLLSDGIVHGYSDSMLDAMTGPMLGHVQIHAPKWRDERAMDLVIDRVPEKLAALGRIEGVEQASPRLYAPALAAREHEGHAVIGIGIDPRKESRPGGLLATISPSRRPRGRSVVVGAALADAMGLKAGDELALVGQGADGSLANDLFTVRGVVRSPIDLVNRMGVLIDLPKAQETFAMPGQAHEIVVRGADSSRARLLAGRIRQSPVFAGTEVLPWRKLAPELVAVIEMSDKYSGVVLLLVFVAAAAGIVNTMLMATFERRREIGMLLSLGTTPGRVVRMIMAEALTLGLLGVAIGSALGAGLVWLTSLTGLSWADLGGEAVRNLAYQGLNYDVRFYPHIELGDVVQGVVAVVATSLLASLWPAVHTAGIEPAGALRA